MTFPGFRPAALAFLRDLAAHNSRPWFEAHRETYDEEVRAPLALLVEEVDARLGTTAPEFTGSPKRNIYRIHRDTRFSKDKAPYKSNAACWWGHRDAARRGEEGAHAGSGLYFELNPTGSYAAGGTWMPARHTLATLRDAIVDDQAGFEATMASAAFRRTWKQLDEEAMLTRLPRGFATGHPAERWLRYQSFTVTAPLTRKDVLSRDLPDLLMRHFASLFPLVRWLNAAQGLKAARRR
jgi:uncharacterized protein (TIGR02453 family)